VIKCSSTPERRGGGDESKRDQSKEGRWGGKVKHWGSYGWSSGGTGVGAGGGEVGVSGQIPSFCGGGK